ncbi:DUF2325 domain-containing protein [Metabacillus herbersteinensis]|uniref:DUF2325 domain-containing protein n=1 Tax=Metabacillus herbersteinensis TaxID=283816 RepID=A0ABV6GKZ6_9BACI
MKNTVAIFGGSQEATYKKIGEKHGLSIIFHIGKTRNGGNKKEFRNLIKKADCVVVMLGACGHVSMDIVKEVSKKLGKEIIFHEGFGASGALKECAERLSCVTAA